MPEAVQIKEGRQTLPEGLRFRTTPVLRPLPRPLSVSHTCENISWEGSGPQTGSVPLIPEALFAFQPPAPHPEAAPGTPLRALQPLALHRLGALLEFSRPRLTKNLSEMIISEARLTLLSKYLDGNSAEW